MSYRRPAVSARDIHEADRSPLDLYGQPLPRPKRHMHRVAGWESAGGWDEDELDGGTVVERPEPPVIGPGLALTLFPTCPDVLPVAVDVDDDPGSEALVRGAKVRAFVGRHARQVELHLPGDHTRPVDYAEAATRLLRAIAEIQIRDSSAIRPPVIEEDRQATRPRYRLRWWKSDARAAKGGRWTNLGSFGDRPAAEAARIAWMREHSPTEVRLDLPGYLVELVPSQAQSRAVAGGFFAA